MSLRSVSAGLAGALTAAVLLSGSAALAAGSSPAPSTPAKCSTLKANSAEWKKCMASNQGSLTNEDLYAAGYSLAKSGDYQGALQFLTAGTDKKDPRFLTMIGYSTRKLGKVDEGMGYYMQALAIDPNSVTTREYLGEAYLQKKDLTGAKAQLMEIQNRCGVSCESFTELNEQIARYQTGL